MKKEARTPVAITVTRNNRKYRHIDVKLCFISKHPDKIFGVWDTEKIMTIDPTKENCPDIVENHRREYDLPFIPGIWRGNEIQLEHLDIIFAFYNTEA